MKVEVYTCPSCGVIVIYQPGSLPAVWQCHNCLHIVDSPAPVLVEFKEVTYE